VGFGDRTTLTLGFGLVVKRRMIEHPGDRITRSVGERA
jgi:hypothetical protein